MVALLTAAIVTLGFAGTDPAATSQPVRVIRATGVGYPPGQVPGSRARLMARRAAEVVAVRNLARHVAGGEYRGSTGDCAGSSVKANVRGYRYLTPRYFNDGHVEVTVELPARAVQIRRHREPVVIEAVAVTAATAPSTVPVVHADVQARLERQIVELERELGRLHARIAELRQAVAELQAACVQVSSSD